MPKPEASYSFYWNGTWWRNRNASLGIVGSVCESDWRPVACARHQTCRRCSVRFSARFRLESADGLILPWAYLQHSRWTGHLHISQREWRCAIWQLTVRAWYMPSVEQCEDLLNSFVHVFSYLIRMRRFVSWLAPANIGSAFAKLVLAGGNNLHFAVKSAKLTPSLAK